MSKFVTKEEFQSEIRTALKKENKKIGLCHGVFDLVHPGHIVHFEQAKQMCDILVVSITAAAYVRKGPDRPYFNDEMRLKFLEAIEYIDYVMLSEGYTVYDIIEAVEPDLYIKGSEYAREDEDITGKIREERELVERHGGKLCFTGGQVFSSTKLINNALSGISEEVRNYMLDFKTRYSMDDIKGYADAAEQLKVLVIGDVIIDKYTYCEIQGLMSKDMGYSAREDYTEEYLGGAMAIARHLSSFTNNVTLMSVIGNEKKMISRLQEELSGSMKLKLYNSIEIPTIVKHRYLEKDSKREEYRKIFAVNNIVLEKKYEDDIRTQFIDDLKAVIDSYDVVFLCDFGHGLINKEIMKIAQEKARYLVLNCQTNSTNMGTNIITKYMRADIFAMDQKELKLACPDLDDETERLKKISKHLGADGWLTRGSKGAYGIDNSEIRECPAFTLAVKDTVGAGDAFFAAAGIMTAAGAPIEVGTVVGNIAGALGANIIGNKDAVEKVNVLKYASTLMNI